MNRTALTLSLLNEIHAKAVCEVGVRTGAFFSVLLRCPTVEKAYAIDIWDDYESNSQNDVGFDRERLAEFYQNFARDFSSEHITIIKKLSVDAVHDLPDGLDFIYLDADHTYEAICKDLVLYYGKLRRGGILAGHDYVDHSFRGVQFGVKKAVDEFVERHGLTLKTSTENKFKSFFIQKP